VDDLDEDEKSRRRGGRGGEEGREHGANLFNITSFISWTNHIQNTECKKQTAMRGEREDALQSTMRFQKRPMRKRME